MLIIWGIKSETLNNIACRIRTFWIENTTVNMPGQKNIEADQQSRILQDGTKWKFYRELFHKIVDKFEKPNVDQFASNINRQLRRYAP